MCISQQCHTEWTTAPLINIKYVFSFNMTNNSHEFVPPFSLYLNVENAPNPARKHFEKANRINMIPTLRLCMYPCKNNQFSNLIK